MLEDLSEQRQAVQRRALAQAGMSTILRVAPAKLCKPKAIHLPNLFFRLTILWLKTHSPLFFQLSACLPPFPGTQVRSGRREKAGEPLQQGVLWIRANSREETQGPWLVSVAEGITQMTISGTRRELGFPFLYSACGRVSGKKGGPQIQGLPWV